MNASVNTFGATSLASTRLEIISPDGSRRLVRALFKAFATPQLTVDSERPIAPLTVVSVEYEDCLFLGEVRRSRATDQGAFEVEIDVKQKVNSLTALMRLRAALLDANAPAPLDMSVECTAARRSA
jgi:hypothetical protein